MQTNDIVARLRGHIAITTRIHYAKDGYPEPVYVHGPSPICQEAADEIERLRKERDEARRRVCEDAIRNGRVYRRVGSDTVRCETSKEVAEMMGWKCFKENTND